MEIFIKDMYGQAHIFKAYKTLREAFKSYAISNNISDENMDVGVLSCEYDNQRYFAVTDPYEYTIHVETDALKRENFDESFWNSEWDGQPYDTV